VNESKREAGLGNEPRLETALRADEEHLGGVARHQLPSDRERRNDVAAGASAGDKNT
jgi:hypothetical protein